MGSHWRVRAELASVPLYILNADEIDSELQYGNCTLGWAYGGSATCAFADTLGARWQGVGNLIVLNAQVIAEHALLTHFAAVVKNVAIHETATPGSSIGVDSWSRLRPVGSVPKNGARQDANVVQWSVTRWCGLQFTSTQGQFAACGTSFGRL